jgi:hypothetical protein
LKITKGNLIIAAACAPMFAMIALLGLNLFFEVGLGLSAQIFPTNWSLKAVVHLERPDRDVLVIKVDNEWTDGEVEANRLMVISTADGAIVAETVRGINFELLGVTPELAWCQLSRDDEDIVALQLPDLDERYDFKDLMRAHPQVNRIIDWIKVDGLDALRIDAKDGYQYRLKYADNSIERLPEDPPPLAPDLVRATGCRWKIPGTIRDSRDCRPIRAGDAAILASYQGESQAKQLALTSKTKGGQVKWTVTEETLFGPREEGAPPRRVFFVAKAKGQLLLVAEDREPEDFFLAAVDLDDGSVRWNLIFR